MIFLDQVQTALNIKILGNQTSLQVKGSANQKSPLKKKKEKQKSTKNVCNTLFWQLKFTQTR